MNPGAIEGLNNASLLENPDIALVFEPGRRIRRIGFISLTRLVSALDLGRARGANLEAYRNGWRLRFSLRDGKGRATRKSVVLHDAHAAEWVRDYLDQARKERPAFRAELREQEHRKRLDARSTKRIASRLASLIRRNGGAAVPEDGPMTDAVAPGAEAAFRRGGQEY